MDRAVREAASTDYLERVLFPTLESRLDRAYPIYGFRRDAQGRWLATRRPASLPDALRTSARLYGERRGIRGLDPQTAFLPWLQHEAPDGQTNVATGFDVAIQRLTQACGIPLPDDLLRDAAFAKKQRLLDLREAAWASVRAHACTAIQGDVLDRLTVVGISEPGIRDGRYPIGLHPGPSTGAYPAHVALRERLIEQGFTEEEFSSVGLATKAIHDALLLGVRDSFGTLRDLLIVRPGSNALAVPLLEGEDDAPRIYGLDVALAAKGGAADLLLVRDPLTAMALHGRGISGVAAMIGPTFDGRTWDELAGSGVRGVRFLVRGIDSAIARIAKTLDEGQLKRMRLRSVSDENEILEPELTLGKRAENVGAKDFIAEIRRLQWRDAVTHEVVVDAEPEILMIEEPAPVASAKNGHDSLHAGTRSTERRTALGAPKPKALRASPLDRPLGDAGEHVVASSWGEDRALEAVPGAADLPRAPSSIARDTEASEDDPAPSDLPHTNVSRELARLSFESLPTVRAWSLLGDLVLECRDLEAASALARQFVHSTLEDQEGVRAAYVAREPRPAWAQEFDASLAARVATVDDSRAVGEQTLVVFEVSTDEDACPHARRIWIRPEACPRQLPGPTTRLRLRRFSREEHARLVGYGSDEVFVDDHLERWRREGRRFWHLELLRDGDVAASVALTEAHAEFREGVSPYPF